MTTTNDLIHEEVPLRNGENIAGVSTLPSGAFALVTNQGRIFSAMEQPAPVPGQVTLLKRLG